MVSSSITLYTSLILACTIWTQQVRSEDTTEKAADVAKIAPGERLQETIDRHSEHIYNLQQEHNRLSHRVSLLEKKENSTVYAVNKMSLKLEDTDVALEELLLEYERLEKIDVVWRHNFRIINNVFTILKRKNNFRAQPIRYGPQETFVKKGKDKDANAK